MYLLYHAWVTEFNQVLQNDSCRLQQLQCHTSAPGHPFNRFFWGKLSKSGIFLCLVILVALSPGLFFDIYLPYLNEGNKKSLSDATERGVNLREQIFKLYHDNYYGRKMKLVIIGGGNVFLKLNIY